MKNKEKRNIILFFIISLITLTSSVFAWFAISTISNIGGIDSNIPDFTNIITFKVKRSNDLDYTLINSIEDMHEVFGKTRPGETYKFIIDFDNDTSKDLTFSLFLKNIITIYNETYDNESSYDLRDLFKIDEGKVVVCNGCEDETGEIISTHILNGGNGNYYLNDLIEGNTNGFVLYPKIVLEAGKKINVSFTLVYDPEIPDITYINYQYNFLSIDGIYVYGQ